MTLKPMCKTGVTSRTIGRETILSSETETAIHILNPTAKLVWDLCDGQHSLEEIEKAMRARFALPPDYPVIRDIQNIIDVLIQKGLLEIPTEPSKKK